MSTHTRHGIEGFKDKLDNVDFLETHEQRILEYVEKHKDNVENWKDDIIEILDITGLDKRQVKAHQHEIAKLIREKCKQLKIFLDRNPHKIDNPFFEKGNNVYKALQEYTYAVEKHNAQKIYGHLHLINAIGKNASKKPQAVEVTTERINSIKEYLLSIMKNYDDAYNHTIADKIKNRVCSVFGWTLITKKRNKELIDKLDLEPHSPKDEITGLDWGYVWLQLALEKNQNDENLKRVKRQIDEGTYSRSAINVVGKIDLPARNNTEMQAQTINPDDFIGKKMPLGNFLSQLSLPEGYQSVDSAISLKEKGFGWIQKIESSRVFVTLGLASDSKEPLENHPKYITVVIPRRLIPVDKLSPETIIPLHFIEKSIYRTPSDKTGPQPKYFIKADYYDEAKHGKMGAIGKALQKSKVK